MLETEEVDDDYFTPVASASLANIFGKSVIDERSENDSLKYTPPKPQNVNKPLEDSKASSYCVFACALVGYEWQNNDYLKIGRLGFALIKVNKTETHNIILYDSNKTTLSNASLTSESKVTVRSNNYISYFDDQRKYWSLYGAENEITTIIELLKTLNVTINTLIETDNNPPAPVTNKELLSLQEDSKKPVESDTDSAVNRKTKVSILNRMANMGHSVLPPNVNAMEKTSDSSDTNDTDYHIKAVRHKPAKGIMKKSITDKTLADQQKIIDIHANVETRRIGQTTEVTNTSSFVCEELVPATTTILSSLGRNDMNLFITEQRISNSELRINMGRMTDKMDHIINKMNRLEEKEQNNEKATINTDILHKLLKEYESKIKNYEELIKKMGTNISLQNMAEPLNVQSNHRNEQALNNRIEKLENIIKEKDAKVLMLQNEVEIIRDAKENQNKALQMNVSELEAELTKNKHFIKELTEENVKKSKTSASNDVESKIKYLMNDTYQAIAANFENDKTYTGESIKKNIAMVIKKVTFTALNDR